MPPIPVVSEAHVQEKLRERGWEATNEKTETATLWKHKETGKYAMIPFSVQGFYPDWMLHDLEELIGKVDPWAAFKSDQRKRKK